MDVSAVVLNKLLTEGSLDIWAKLKLVFLDPAYSSLYSIVNKHYEKYNSLPTFDDLELTLREGPAAKTLATLKLTEVPDVTAEVALDALIDQYTQNETVKLLDKFVDKLPIYDTVEIKDNLANIVLTLDEKTLTTEGVFSMSDIMLFQQDEERARPRHGVAPHGYGTLPDLVAGGVEQRHEHRLGRIGDVERWQRDVGARAQRVGDGRLREPAYVGLGQRASVKAGAEGEDVGPVAVIEVPALHPEVHEGDRIGGDEGPVVEFFTELNSIGGLFTTTLKNPEEPYDHRFFTKLKAFISNPAILRVNDLVKKEYAGRK